MRKQSKGSQKAPERERYSLRLEKLKKIAKENYLDGVILVPGPNLRYYTGNSSLLLERPFLFFVPADESPRLIAPKLESGPYRRAPIEIIVHDWDDSEGSSQAFEKVVAQIQLSGKWALEGRVPFRFIHELQKHANPQLEDAEPVLQGIRELKDPEEIRSISTAAAILCKSFLKIPDLLRSGITEMEVARKIREQIYSNGAESADDVLVQSGGMAADPHHLPSSKKVKRGESVVVDATCTYSGYYADITRTFILGKERRFENIYENVLEAQKRAIEICKARLPVGSVDHAARSHLKNNNLDRYFIHRTGHGLGLEVHEAPYIVPAGELELQPSMVFTIEPGVYIPGKMGVRIEDDILIEERATKVLTKDLPKELYWWS